MTEPRRFQRTKAKGGEQVCREVDCRQGASGGDGIEAVCGGLKNTAGRGGAVVDDCKPF